MGTGSSLSSRSSKTSPKSQGQPPPYRRKASEPLSVRDLDATVEVVSPSGCHCSKNSKPWSLLTRKQNADIDADGDVIKRGPTWKEQLEEATTAELWDGRLRSQRSGWKSYLKRAQRLVQEPRPTLSQEVVSKVLEGDLCDLHNYRPHSSKVTVFLSSTFTDTKAERNQLMKDVFPFLRTLCHVLGLDFGSVDMRWGVREETTREHGTTDICLQQVKRCCQESCGPAFLTILGNKYGFRPLPVRINQTEFDNLLHNLRNLSQPTNDITDHYLLDENNVPPVYILKPRDPNVSNEDWWNISQELQRRLQLAARSLPVVDEREKYFISVTEQEIREGCSRNERRNSQVVYVSRTLEDISHKHHQNRHFIDMVDGKVDAEAQEYMSDLKYNKLPNELSQCPESVLRFNYSDQKENCLKQVKKTCDEICRVLCEQILAGYKSQLNVINDTLYDEVIRHSQFLRPRVSVFKGHEKLISRIKDKVVSERGQEKHVTAVYGTSGSGKTSAMAVLAKSLKMDLMPEACLILRFIGTTSASGSVYDLVLSICQQIARVYQKDPAKVPDDYDALLEYFRLALTFSTESKPMLIVLDSLDQLINGNLGHTLKWLPVQTTLPLYTHILVSTNPGECQDVLQNHLPKASVFELPYLQKQSALEAVKGLLEIKNRTITDQQMEVLAKAFEWNPFPLYLKMLVDVAVTWRSYDVITDDNVAAGASGMTSLLFERLEARYGQILVHHALAYISASKHGLSQNELEDVLSCDDDALDELFEFWLPPVRRIPPLLWIRIRNDLSDFLMEKGSDGTILYTWYYKQVRQMAAARYLDKSSPPFREEAHRTLADYYEGKWVSGKTWVPKAKSRTVKDLSPRMENRMVTPQPLVFAGGRRDRQRQLNRRKLRELPYHLLQIGDLGRLEEVATNLEFIEAKFEAGQGYDCLSILKMAARGTSTPLLQAMGKVICGSLQYLLREPWAIYQLIHQQIETNPTTALLTDAERSCYPLKYIREEDDGGIEDPCEMTLRGHTSGVRCCQYSPDGAFIASTGEDGSLRIWDAQTGSEHVTVMGLPGAVYPKMADVGAVGDRPCVWDMKSSLVVTGSEDGSIQAWTRTGAATQTSFNNKEAVHTKAITGLSVSPDNLLLASSSKDGLLKVWSMKDFQEVHTLDLKQSEIKDTAFSPDGSKLALVFNFSKDRKEAGTNSGLNVYSTSDWSLKTSQSGDEGRKFFCLSFSPAGGLIATGSDMNVVELWMDGKSKANILPKRHHAYVKCVRFSHGGRYVISCGDDIMVMLWDVEHQRHLVTVAGHVHRVTSVSVHPKGEGRIVTASHDTTLKVWNYEAITEGRVPEADGIPFVVVQPSHDRKYVMTVQGVNSFARLYEVTGLGRDAHVWKTPKQKYSICAALWTRDASRIVLLNAGHSGNFTKDAYTRAGVQVIPFTVLDSSNENSVDLDVKGPTCIGVGHKYVAVGTYSGDILLFDETELSLRLRLCWCQTASSDKISAKDVDKDPNKGTNKDPRPDRGAGRVQIGEGAGGRISSVDLHPNKDHVAAASGGELRIWSLRKLLRPKQKASFTTEEGQQIQECKFTPDGSRLVFTAMSTIVVISAASHYERLYVISGHEDHIQPITVCPLSHHLATASLDGTIRVWRLGGGQRQDGGLVAVYYNSTARRVSFLSTSVLLVGSGTGPLRKLVIEETHSVTSSTEHGYI